MRATEGSVLAQREARGAVAAPFTRLARGSNQREGIGRYVATITPLPVVTTSTRLKFVSGRPSENKRRPAPSVSG
jgi:hypothetical protein